MPTYGYRCSQCGHELEVFQSMSAEPLRVCSECGGALRKLLYPVGVHFKGSGFYTTDYKNGGAGASSKKDGSDSGSSESPATGAGTETKSSSSDSSSGAGSSGDSGSSSGSSSGSGSASSEKKDKKADSTAGKE